MCVSVAPRLTLRFLHFKHHEVKVSILRSLKPAVEQICWPGGIRVLAGCWVFCSASLFPAQKHECNRAWQLHSFSATQIIPQSFPCVVLTCLLTLTPSCYDLRCSMVWALGAIYSNYPTCEHSVWDATLGSNDANACKRFHNVQSCTLYLQVRGSLRQGNHLNPEVWGQLPQQDFVLKREVGQREERRGRKLLLMVPWSIQTSKNIEMWK